jgi:hypothetical protein
MERPPGAANELTDGKQTKLKAINPAAMLLTFMGRLMVTQH